MSIRCLLLLAAPGLLACRGKAEDATAPHEPTPIEVRDGSGVVAHLRPGHPCRAAIGPVELIVGGPPLVAQDGDTRWSGAAATNGITLTRNGSAVVRLYPTDEATAEDVIGPDGVALVRIKTTETGAMVSGPGGALVRTLQVGAPGTFTSTTPKLTITGTPDVLTAAILSAPELPPEVRMLAACERVLAKPVAVVGKP